MEEQSFPPDREIAEEHCAIRTIAKWIELELVREEDSPEGVQSDGPLLGPLRAFHKHLEEHFRFEEESGVLAAAILTRPRASFNLEKWYGQHRRLLLRLAGAIRQLAETPSGKSPGDGFSNELREFFADLRVHDRFEDDLLGVGRAPEFRDQQRSYEQNKG